MMVGPPDAAEMLQASWCFDSGTPQAITEGIKAELEALGWQNVAARSTEQRFGISAHHGALVLFGSVQQGNWAACSGEDGQTYVNLSVRQNPRARADAGP